MGVSTIEPPFSGPGGTIYSTARVQPELVSVACFRFVSFGGLLLTRTAFCLRCNPQRSLSLVGASLTWCFFRFP
jgi:hypothetical protein